MLLDFVLIASSLILIAAGSNRFVDSSINISRTLNIPRFVIGGTLVSLTTNAPEIVVSVTASMLGDSGIALGNAVGSSISNIGLIVGTVALITPISADIKDFSRRVAWMFAGGILVVLFSLDGTLSRPLGTVLLLLAVTYLYLDYCAIRRAQSSRDVTKLQTDSNEYLMKSILSFLVGAILIIVGSRFLVQSGQNLAIAFGIPSTIIGFSVVAVGTSLPELVTGVTAALKKVPDLALGTIIGSNVLNLLLIVGLSGTIQPISVERFTLWYAFPWMGIFFVGPILLILRNGSLGRVAGLLLLILYLLHLTGLVMLPAVGLM